MKTFTTLPVAGTCDDVSLRSGSTYAGGPRKL